MTHRYRDVHTSLRGPRGTQFQPQYKYAVFPGMILADDGDTHFIRFADLCRLYGVPPRECFEVLGATHTDISELIHLRPQRNGNYTLPQKETT